MALAPERMRYSDTGELIRVGDSVLYPPGAGRKEVVGVRPGTGEVLLALALGVAAVPAAGATRSEPVEVTAEIMATDLAALGVGGFDEDRIADADEGEREVMARVLNAVIAGRKEQEGE